LDFSNKNLMLLGEFFGHKLYLTETLLATWVVMAVLIIFAVIVRLRLRHFRGVPKGFQNVVEALVEAMHSFTVTTMGAKLEGFGGYFFSVFAFILLSNYSGLVGLRPPTSNLATTAALAVSTFVMVQVAGIVCQRGYYVKSFFEPFVLFFPINVVGELAKPISLAFRLFGNILGGVIIMGLVYQMLPIVLRFVLPNILHAYFDIFAGALQAFIFTVLSMTFIQQKSVIEE